MARYSGDRDGHCRTCKAKRRLTKCTCCNGRGGTLTTQCSCCRNTGYACERGVGNKHHPWS